YRGYLIKNNLKYDIGRAQEILLLESNYPSESLKNSIIEHGEIIMEKISIPDNLGCGVETAICKIDGDWYMAETMDDAQWENCYMRGYVDFWYIIPPGLNEETGETGKPVLYVEDDKTGYTDYSKDEINIQIMLYASALYDVLKREGVIDISDEIIMTVRNLFMDSRSWTEKMNINDIRKTVDEYVSNIQNIFDNTVEFTANIGPACDWCEYKIYCNEYSEKLGAERLVLDYQEKSALAAQAEKYLRDYLKENGNIQVGDRIYGIFEKDRFQYDGPEIVKFLADYMDIMDYMIKNFHMSNTDFVKLAKKYKIEAALYKPLAQTKKVESMGWIDESK
ncbi:MAG: hypothetical protein ABIJ97_03220, partial [Bacteroidota bacterium]